ncbi:hypothetical protein M885DRAFT_3328 [Pelagophyceae sp. CCMP2097]|nr:hypothetical protein M885DRAFT_3328 [Pelagophyceae sp. CCMP2097]
MVLWAGLEAPSHGSLHSERARARVHLWTGRSKTPCVHEAYGPCEARTRAFRKAPPEDEWAKASTTSSASIAADSTAVAVLKSAVKESFGETSELVHLFVAFEKSHVSQTTLPLEGLAASTRAVSDAQKPPGLDARAADIAKQFGYSEKRDFDPACDSEDGVLAE